MVIPGREVAERLRAVVAVVRALARVDADVRRQLEGEKKERTGGWLVIKIYIDFCIGVILTLETGLYNPN